MKQPNSSKPTQAPKLDRKLLAVAFILSLAVVALFVSSLPRIKTDSPRGTITDEVRIATHDTEFADFIGPGHNLAEYYYIDAKASQRLDFGYGPLYEVAGYQVIIGKTGAVGAIAYGSQSHGKWDLYPGPDRDWSEAFILVFDGCVAPEEWRNRPVLASMLYGVPTTDGGYLPELMVWVPWPDWMDFDNPPTSTTIQAQSWYWNGVQFVPANFVEDQFPLFSSSQISIKGAPRGAFPHFKQLYDIIRE